MPTYEVTYTNGHGSSYVYGRTRSAAKYNKYLDLDGAFETFKDFLSAVQSVRKVSPVAGAYDFITRQYGSVFNVGDAVTITGEGSATGKVGEVIHPSGGGGAYVHVLLNDKECLFHPMSLINSHSKESNDG